MQFTRDFMTTRVFSQFHLESDSEDEIQTHDDVPVKKTLRIHRIRGAVAEDDTSPVVEWTWTELSEVDQDGKGCTLFSWDA